MVTPHQASLSNAYVIHSRPYRETSLIADLLTEEDGRVSVLFKGVRGSKARNKGLLQPFNRLLVSWQGRRDLKTATGLEAGDHRVVLQGHYLFSAMYANELLQRLLQPHDPHPELFQLYSELLQALGREVALEPLLRSFELQLLDLMGYGLPLSGEARSGDPIEKDGWYQYDPREGFYRILTVSDTQQHNLFSGDMLHALAMGNIVSSEQLYAAKRLMRLAFAPLLGDRPLRSRELFS
ncbi:DNA repair protein RecO [Aestuariirhabdus sp. Z084]|uniref:DNA repair protein RecO n=1 Tax=Aestuariirhabdus haliotis TaxID=2918751 RepID=UPI00201B4301|nr:DNA repair protein RecO [Aestuariirhabdus haliotis]MCL6417148.1 DNA repair protein RecO [Aestuariirhabdus haliotis]MCL6421120.1 DNA repair protein RecO [Aestuariirhabdus haliotis]